MTEPVSLGEEEITLPRYNDNKKILINTILASNLPCIYNRLCQRYETENQIFTPKRAADEEQIDLDPEHLTWITQKTAENARSSRRLLPTTQRESQNMDSESFRTSIICQSGGKWTTLHYQ